MRKTIQKVFIGLTIILTFALSGFAAERLTVNIPFDFRVGDTSLLSGAYNVELMNGRILKITSAEGRGSVFGTSIPSSGNNSEQNILVFHRYGDVYLLSEVIWAGGDQNRKLLPQRRPIELAGNSQGVRVVKLIGR